MAIDHSPRIAGEIPEAQFAEQLLAQIHACQPLMTNKDCDAVEKVASSAEFGIGRRIGLVVATMSGQRFQEVSTSMDRQTAAAFAEGLAHLGDYINRTEEMVVWLHAAWWRMFTSLAARDDADSLGLDAAVVPKGAKQAEVTHG